MRLINLWLGSALLLIAASAQAQVLWSVTGPDDQQNWLLGTVHSEDPRLLDLPAELVEVLHAADRLALELTPDAATVEHLNEAMYYDTGRLDEVLEPEIYEQVVAIVEREFGMGEPAVRRMRPWAVAMTLSVPPPETGMFMDLALSLRAQGMGLDVVALETIEEQIGFLTSLEQDAQLELLRQAVRDYDQLDEMFEELLAAYLDGDLDELERLSEEQLADMDPRISAHFTEVGLIQRNQVMFDRAEDWLAEGGLLIAVGALHLPGEGGLIDLLESAGYQLKPLTAGPRQGSRE